MNVTIRTGNERVREDIPDDGGLDDVFTILVDSLQDVRRLSLDLSLDGQVEVDTDLLRLEVYSEY